MKDPHAELSKVLSMFWGIFGHILVFTEHVSKSHSAEKNCKGDLLVSSGMVCYAEKEEKPFWFSSLGQMSQFGP